MSDVVEWIEQSPYGRALGVSCEFVSDEAARLELAFKETNSNPGGALHGGVAASLSLIGAQAVARTQARCGVESLAIRLERCLDVIKLSGWPKQVGFCRADLHHMNVRLRPKADIEFW